MLSLALYQPEIATNLGASIRIAACFGVPLHVIEPCGFPYRDKDIGRVAMDYQTNVLRHRDWDAFGDGVPGRRVLFTTKSNQDYAQFAFAPGDVLLFGQESAGVSKEVHDSADARVTIPMAPAARSLNLSVSTAIGLAEACRQLGLHRDFSVP